MRALQLKPKEWICLLHVQSIGRYHYRNRFSKDGLSSALGVRSKEIGMSPFSMHFIRVLLPEVWLKMEAVFHYKKKKDSHYPSFWAGAGVLRFRLVVNSDVCVVRLALAKRTLLIILALRIPLLWEDSFFFFFYACHDFCLKKHNPLSFSPSTSLVEKK